MAERLLSSYEMACADTPLDGSRLVIEEVPVVVFCPHCAGRAAAERRCRRFMLRRTAARPRRDIRQGRELELVALEIES